MLLSKEVPPSFGTCSSALLFTALQKRSSVNSNTLRDAQIWGIMPHIALAASGFSCASA